MLLRCKACLPLQKGMCTFAHCVREQSGRQKKYVEEGQHTLSTPSLLSSSNNLDNNNEVRIKEYPEKIHDKLSTNCKAADGDYV